MELVQIRTLQQHSSDAGPASRAYCRPSWPVTSTSASATGSKGCKGSFLGLTFPDSSWFLLWKRQAQQRRSSTVEPPDAAVTDVTSSSHTTCSSFKRPSSGTQFFVFSASIATFSSSAPASCSS